MFDPRPLCCSSLTTAVGGILKQILLIPLTLPWHESNGAVCRGLVPKNGLSEAKNGEFDLDFEVGVKTMGWWFAN